MSGACDCEFFGEGDWVECKLNPDQFGIIINETAFGRYYEVQLAGTMEVKTFHWATLAHLPKKDPPPSAVFDGTNVVRVDFTKKTRLRPDSDTKGAA